jgi:putative addiction module component (TIGR02574 family)
MPTKLDTLSREALALPAAQRAALARTLIRSLDEDADPDAAAVGAAWDEEIARRIADVESGRVTARPDEIVLKEMRAKYG